MTIKPGIKPTSPASVVACRHAKQRSKLNKSHLRQIVKVMPLFIWFVLLNVCVSRKVKMPWSTRRDQKPVCTSVGSPNHCLKFKKRLIYSNTFIWLKCLVFMNKHVDVFRINNLQFNYQFYIWYQRGASSFLHCFFKSSQKYTRLCTNSYKTHTYVSKPWVSQKYSLFESNISRGHVWIKKIIWYFNRECKQTYDKSLNREKKPLSLKWQLNGIFK